MNSTIDRDTPVGCAFWRLCQLLEQLRHNPSTAAYPVEKNPRPEAGPPALVYTVAEAAGVLRISRTKPYELLAAGQIRSVLVGRCRRIPVDALTAYLAGAQTVPATMDTRPARRR